MCEHKAVDFDVPSGTWVCGKCGIAVGMAGMMMSTAHREEDFTGTIIAQQIKPEEDIEQLHACRAALRDCAALLDESLGYVTTNWIRNRADYVAQVESAITNARKALGE